MSTLTPVLTLPTKYTVTVNAIGKEQIRRALAPFTEGFSSYLISLLIAEIVDSVQTDYQFQPPTFCLNDYVTLPADTERTYVILVDKGYDITHHMEF